MPPPTFDANADLCPPDYVTALLRYIDSGTAVNSFLEAVLCNDLYKAIDCATGSDILALPHVCAWVYHNMPLRVYGSKEMLHEHFIACQTPKSSSKIESNQPSKQGG